MSLSGGLGGAAGGAATGAAFGPWGIGIGAGVGGLIGLLSGNEDPVYPGVQLSPEALASVNFRDINLAQMNPDLYAQLMKNNAMLQEASRLYSQKSDSNSPLARRRMTEDATGAAERMQSQGLAGSPAGEAMMADVQARLREQAAAQAYQQQMGAFQQMANLQQQQYGNTANALQMGLGQANQNRNSAIQLDQIRNQQALGKFQNDSAESQAQNQFWSGLFNSGMQGLGNYANANMKQDFMKQAYPDYKPQSYSNYLFG